MITRNALSAITFTLILSAIPAIAQTATAPSTCTTPPTGLASFLLEHSVDVTTIQTTNTPKLPASVTNAIFSGVSDVRSRLTYNPTTQIMQNDLYLVPKGSPAVTALPLPANFGYLTIKVNSIQFSCMPRPSVLLTGTVLAGVDIFAPPAGAAWAYSFGYDLNNTANPFNNSVSDSVALGLLFAAQAQGSITFTSAPAGPSIVIAPAALSSGKLQVFANQLALDASKSSDPSGSALTYQWGSDKPAAFYPNTTSPSPTMVFQSGSGDYTVTLTVTNAAGATATAKYVVTSL